MKNILAIFVALIMLLIVPAFSMITFAAAGDEIITNGNFSSNTNGWSSQTGATLERYNVGSWLSRDYVLKVTDRTEATWSSPIQDVTNGILEWGWGEYNISARVKLINSQSEYFQYVITANIDGENKWFTGAVVATDSGFTTLSATVNIQPDNVGAVLSSVTVAFQMTAGVDFYVDDISLRKTDASTQVPIKEATPENNGPIENRPTQTSVGVIRWDAWVNPSEPWDSGNEDTRTIGQQMVDSLSPSKYHYRLPFFAQILGTNSITFPDYTQEIFDQEMRYAKEAGIDYFTYCWYGESDVMSTARKLHTTSRYRTDVKMSGIWTIHYLDSDTLEELINYLKQEFWFKVDGRPLVYINSANVTSVYAINKFRQACIEAGVGNPYLIGLENMGCTTDDVKNLGIDAISTYATYQGGGASYSTLVNKTETLWNTWKDTGVEVVPFVSTGWNRNPRVANPPSWELDHTGTENDYTQDGTPEEIAQHLQNAINFNNNNKSQTSANTVLVYAWNEHDEGGWICPTIKVDSNGLPLTNSDGSYQRDDSRLQAIQKVIKGQNITWNLNDANVTYEIKGATLNLGSTLTINYYAKAAAGYKIQFTMNGNSRTVDGVYDSQKGLYKYAFTGINPQCMNDTVDAVIVDSNENQFDYYNGYSVRKYCNNKANTTAKDNNMTQIQFESMLTLIADTLNYGAASQEYMEYKTENLANSETWVKDYESAFTVPQGVKVLKGNNDPDGIIRSAGLSMSNVNKIYFRLNLNSADVVITLNGETISRNKLIKDGDSYLLYTDDLTATEFDKVFTLTLTKGGQEISSIQYNVKAFIEAKYLSASVGNISKALNNYGSSATRYVQAMYNDVDFDFDLGYDDVLTNNVIPNLASTFDYASSPEAVGWYVPNDWNTTMSLVDDGFGGKALAFTTGESWESAAFNIKPYVQAGTYTISFRYKTIGDIGFTTTVRINTNSTHETFNTYVTKMGDCVWGEFTGTITISENDTYQNTLDFCMHSISGSGMICIDDFQVVPN